MVSIAPVLGGDLVPDGQFVRVNLIARNTPRGQVQLPVSDLLLIDAAGGVADVDAAATSTLAGDLRSSPIGIGDSKDRAVVFAARDADSSFLLDSTEVSTFRVDLAIEAS